MTSRKSQVAESTPFDNDTNGFISEDVQGAIEELSQTIATSASPGFSFGRASNVTSGTWLQCEGVPSNKAGRFVYINSATIEKLFISSETISTYTIEIYTHEGDATNLTLISSATVTSARGGVFTISQAITTNTQIALRLSAGSARNIVAGLELSGSN
jgi:hypothetical protein